MNSQFAQKTEFETQTTNEKENYSAKMKFCILQCAKSINSRNQLLLFALEK